MSEVPLQRALILNGKLPQKRLTRGTVISTMRMAAHPSGCARCGAGAGYSAIKHESLVKGSCQASGTIQGYLAHKKSTPRMTLL